MLKISGEGKNLQIQGGGDIEVNVKPASIVINEGTGIDVYKRQELIRSDPMIGNSLTDNKIYAMYKDNENGIWIGTVFGGDVYKRQRQSFRLLHISTVHGLIIP